MKKKLFYLVSFLIPTVVLGIVFYFKGILTGQMSLLLSDLWGQYYGLMINLKRILDGSASIFYSFRIGFGQPFIATFAYYLASPINLLIYFFNNVQYAIIYIILLKIGLCGLTMYIYLKYHFKKETFFLLLFSSTYALSTFIISNYFQLMWLDAYFLSPLVLLGIDYLIDKDKFFIYGITLFLTVTINYYMGYMVCLFSILYFLYKLFILKRNRKIIIQKITEFAIVSLLFGLLSMFINYPNILSLINIDRNSNELSYQVYTLFNTKLWENLSMFYIGNHSINNPLNVYYAYYYLSILYVPLLYFYFINKNISKREKILSLMLFIILFLSIVITPLNNVWHAFSRPIGFNYRYLFLFLIFIIYICTKSFINLEKRNIRHNMILIIIILVLSNFVYIFDRIDLLSLYVTNGLFILYNFILYLYSKSLKRDQFIIKIMLLILVLAELYFNTHYIFVKTELFYNKSVNGVSTEKAETLNYIKSQDNSLFYRTEFYNSLYNDSILYDYYSASGWYSTMAGSNVAFLKKMGYAYLSNTYEYNSMLVTDSLFGIKYYIVNNDNYIYDNIKTVQVSEMGGFLFGKFMTDNYIYKNPYALSIGYMVEDNKFDSFNCSTFNLCQQQLLSLMLKDYSPVYGISPVDKIDDTTFKFKINKNDNLVLYFDSVQYSGLFSYDIYINGTYVETKNNFSNLNINLKNNNEIGTEVTISIKNIKGTMKINNITLMYENVNNFKSVYSELSKNQLNITSFKDGYIKGHIEATNSKTMMFTSIPYSDGWIAYVDGQKTEIRKIYDVFIGIVLTPGEHEIELVYKTPGIKTGIFISAFSFTGIVVFALYKKKKNKTVIY